MASKHKLDFVNSELQKIKQNNLHRNLQYGTVNGPYITINRKKLINLGSNDYLGIKTKVKHSQLQSSSRLVSGNDAFYKKLEKALAHHKSKQNSLVYPTGYMANLGTIPTMAKKGDVIFSDELNHTSIIEACKLSGAKIIIYKHNDMQDLKNKIKCSADKKFLVTEGIFSMDGDYSALKEITEFTEKDNIITILDDAHGDFVTGKDGKGSANHFNVSKKIDLYISSLSKGLGSFGGYVATSNSLIDLFINRSRSFIYTSALPSFLVEHSLSQFYADREQQRKKLIKNTRYLKKGLIQIGFKIDSQTQIIPIIIGDERKTVNFAKHLFKKGLFIQPIRYPTVKKGQARLRISVTALLSKSNIDDSLEIIEHVSRKLSHA